MSLKRRPATVSDNSSFEDCEETLVSNKDPWASPCHYDEPSVREWLAFLVPTREGVHQYGRGLLVFLQWLPHYDPSWIVGDIIAGVTVGFVVIPQAMAYALLASLPPQYGLYTSFAGAVLYFIFGTSKDVIIGTTAVGSLLVGSVIAKVDETYPGVYTHVEVAKALSAVAGVILIALGLLRLGWLVDFVPYVPVSAFVTAASITLMSTQFPVVLGIQGINTRDPPYRVIINTFKNLHRARVDAAIGLSCLATLYLIKFICRKLAARQPHRKTFWSIISSLRMTCLILICTLISYLINRHSPSHPHFRIVGHIERGFPPLSPPSLPTPLLLTILPSLPALLTILILEHIAIATSFSRSSSPPYPIHPSNEILSQGFSNVLGTFFGGYACTGSFTASAVLSGAGSRTPLASFFAAVMLVVALYGLTGMFFWIPNAALAGGVVHAVAGMVAEGVGKVRGFWRVSPVEVGVWTVGVVVGVVVSLEGAIYGGVGMSLGIMLVRGARGRGVFLGRGGDGEESLVRETARRVEAKETVGQGPEQAVHPGVVIYRFPEGLNYTNQGQHTRRILEHVKTHTRRGLRRDDGQVKESDRLWIEPPGKPGHLDDSQNQDETLPTLYAIVLDCSSVNFLDVTSVNGLADTRNAVGKHAGRQVEWHFGGLRNRWAMRALRAVGFGCGDCQTKEGAKSAFHTSLTEAVVEAEGCAQKFEKAEAKVTSVLFGKGSGFGES